MKIQFHIFILALSTVLLTSCNFINSSSDLKFITKHTKTDAIVADKNQDTFDDSVFNTLQKDIFASSCIRCHNPESALTKSRLDLTQKEVIRDNLDEIISRMQLDPTEKEAMPPRGERVDKELISRLKQWQEDPIFVNIQVNIFEASCVKCHNPNNTRRMDFTTKENIILYFDEAFYRMGEAYEDNNRPMPPVGKGTQVPKNYLVLYETWFNSLTR